MSEVGFELASPSWKGCTNPTKPTHRCNVPLLLAVLMFTFAFVLCLWAT